MGVSRSSGGYVDVFVPEQSSLTHKQDVTVPIRRIEEEITGIPNNDVSVVGPQARYAMPTVGSMLPAYANAESEFINNAFSKVAFHGLQDIPDDLHNQGFISRRHAVLEAGRLTVGELNVMMVRTRNA
jgi:cellobiose-specific phosphotransferase system component IIB